MGNPFINAVYIGHPGWKAMGGRIGYSAATGIMVILLCWFGTISLMLALIPSVAILPILLYIGMLIGSQAFQETPQAPRAGDRAVARAASRQLGADADQQCAGGGGNGGRRRSAPRRWANWSDKMRAQGVLYDGLHVLGGGSILGGLILGAIAVFIIDRDFVKASGFALAGAVLTFFGFMHGEQIGIGQTPTVAVSYLVIAGIFLRLSPVRRCSPADVDRRRRMHGETARGPDGLQRRPRRRVSSAV